MGSCPPLQLSKFSEPPLLSYPNRGLSIFPTSNEPLCTFLFWKNIVLFRVNAWGVIGGVFLKIQSCGVDRLSPSTRTYTICIPGLPIYLPKPHTTRHDSTGTVAYLTYCHPQQPKYDTILISTTVKHKYEGHRCVSKIDELDNKLQYLSIYW